MKSALQKQILHTLDLYRDMLAVQERAIAEEDLSRLEESLRRIQELLTHLHTLKRAFDRSPEKSSAAVIARGETIRTRFEEIRARQKANDTALTEKTAIFKERLSTFNQRPGSGAISVFRPPQHGGNMVDVSV